MGARSHTFDFSFSCLNPVVVSKDYELDLSTVVVPAVPDGSFASRGVWVSANDGTDNYITTSSTDSAILFNGCSTADTTTFTFTVEFAGTLPSYDYLWAAIYGNLLYGEYQVTLCRGSGGLPGSLWVQKGSTTLGSTFVGTAATTLTSGIKYDVTVTVTLGSSRTFDVSIQRESDSKWLVSDGSWSVTEQVALSVSDHSPIPDTGIGGISFNTYTSSGSTCRLYAYGFNEKEIVLAGPGQRDRSTPVLTKGGTYGGWTADALASAVAIWDGTQYVMTVSLWNDALSEWASAFFTSTDLVTWTYVTGSLMQPSGSDYILGNNGLAWFGSKYWYAYNVADGGTVALSHSTDLINWTTVNPLLTGAADPGLSVNPDSGKLELWYMGTDRVAYMQDSPDGTTWTARGAFMYRHVLGATQDFGAINVFYIGSTRYMTFDGSVCNGFRRCFMAHSVGQDTNWVYDDQVLGPQSSNSWESVSVFDASIIVTDTGDGHGSAMRIIYSGSNLHNPTDATSSSIGLARLPLP